MNKTRIKQEENTAAKQLQVLSDIIAKHNNNKLSLWDALACAFEFGVDCGHKELEEE